MLKYKIFVLIFTAFGIACAPDSKEKGGSGDTQDTTENKQEAPIVGGDKDEHGCIGSAGYQWSELRKECIRIFEAGIRMDPQAPDLDPGLSAFAVFKSENNESMVELFIPGLSRSTVLVRSTDGEESAWSSTYYSLKRSKGIYSLLGNTGEVMYTGTGR